MEPFSTVASSLAILEATVKAGGILLDKYTAYKHAKGEIFELYVRYRGAWLQIQDEIQILKCLVDSLEEPLLRHLNDQLLILEAKLQASASKLDRTIKSDGKVAAKKYGLYRKEPLKDTVDELEAWSLRFRPSWFSTARTLRESLSRYIPAEETSQSQAALQLSALQSSLRLDHQDASSQGIFLSELDLVDKRTLFGSYAIAASNPDSHLDLILDEVEDYGQDSPFAIDMNDVASMANKLATVDDPLTWGLLPCQGVLKVRDDRRSTTKCLFVFRLSPTLSEPHSLRDHLHNSSAPSLNERIKLARSLARSVMFVHNLNFVHKNIRPETILTFHVASDPIHARTACLIGFESFRHAEGPTHRSQERQWEKDLYRHPSRQGIRPLVRYAMQHDIYSLGVCLLEIGLWTSFVKYTPDGTGTRRDLGTKLAAESFVVERDWTRRAYQTKDSLARLAHEALPSKMGMKYTRVVQTCLSSWEEDSENTLFGPKEEFVDQGGVLEGVRYSEKVLLELEDIVV